MVNTSDLKETLTPIFDSYGIKKAVLFGSVAKGTATDKSDIDIMVDSNLRGLKFLGLYENIKKATGRDIDLIDITHIEKNSIVEHEIQKTGIVIYGK